jgi:3-oxoadipate enol-lactonase
VELLIFEVQTIDLGKGQGISYIDLNPTGEKTILLLHGLGTNGASWQLQFETLTGLGYRVIAPDLPGFGKSQYTGRRWTIRTAAALLKILLDRLGIARADVAGISMGGTIALQFGLDYPQQTGKLVLVNTFASLRPDRLNGWYYLLKRFFIVVIRGAPQQATVVAERLFPGADQAGLRQVLIEQIEETDRKVYRAAMLELGLFDARQRLRKLAAPTLVISGLNDSTVPLKNQNALAAGIPGAKRLLIPQAGHAIIVDQPEAFNSGLSAFLRQPPAGL